MPHLAIVDAPRSGVGARSDGSLLPSVFFFEGEGVYGSEGTVLTPPEQETPFTEEEKRDFLLAMDNGTLLKGDGGAGEEYRKLLRSHASLLI